MFEALNSEEQQQYSSLVENINDRLCHGVHTVEIPLDANPLVVSHVVREFQRTNWDVKNDGKRLVFSSSISKPADNKPADYPTGIRSVSQP